MYLFRSSGLSRQPSPASFSRRVAWPIGSMLWITPCVQSSSRIRSAGTEKSDICIAAPLNARVDEVGRFGTQFRSEWETHGQEVEARS